MFKIFTDKFSVLNKRTSRKRIRASSSSTRKDQRLHNLRLERLEERVLLSVSSANYAAIRQAYPALNLPAKVSALNVIEIKATKLTPENLQTAIDKAKATSKDDLIVVRTTDNANTIKFDDSDDQIVINVNSSRYGALNIVAFGTQPLTIDAAQLSRVLCITNGEV